MNKKKILYAYKNQVKLKLSFFYGLLDLRYFLLFFLRMVSNRRIICVLRKIYVYYSAKCLLEQK